MRLSVGPDLRSPRRVLLVAGIVSAIVAVALGVELDVRTSLGDTDDAMRLVMVRDLLAGQGWYDPSISRIDPPHGLMMHWSRLLDGGIAGLMWVLRLVVPAERAEWLTRVIWPLAWIPPAVAAALWLARNLGGRSAVMIAAVLLLVDLEIYRQFIPGRIDHHNVQIVMTLVSAACATAPSRRAGWGALGGAATALGLAVGLEAIVLHALIGCVWVSRLSIDPRDRRAVVAYGASLALASVTAFALQTPPSRWSLSVCDALGANLTLALATAGVGLLAVGLLGSRLAAPGRWAALAAVGAAAGGVYLALDPVCVRGPFAEIDPFARRLWLDTVSEVQPLSVIFRLYRTLAVNAVVFIGMSLAASVFLVIRAPRPATLSVAALLGVAIVSACFVWRMLDYVFWLGVPAIAGAGSLIAARRLADTMAPTLAAAIVLSPSIVGAAANAADQALTPNAARGDANAGLRRCSAPLAFAQLRDLPPGVVLSEPDLGPFLLAFTRDAAVVGPYHRLSRQIVAVHDAFDAAPGDARAKVRALGAQYVVDCKGLALVVRSGSFGERLRAGVAPAWLERLSPPKATLAVYRVLTPR